MILQEPWLIEWLLLHLNLSLQEIRGLPARKAIKMAMATYMELHGALLFKAFAQGKAGGKGGPGGAPRGPPMIGNAKFDPLARLEPQGAHSGPDL